MLNKTNCATCGLTFNKWVYGMPGPRPTDSRTFGKDIDGREHCDVCCGDQDKKQMLKTGKSRLYLSRDDRSWILTNWPGTLVIRLLESPSKGRHNFAGTRYDVWFRFEGIHWHGVQYGENTQICHVRRVK